MRHEKLEHAVDAIRVRFGDQVLVRGGRLLPAVPWPTGQPAVDRLSGIGGLPKGRISVLQGAEGSRKTTLGEALLAQAAREHATTVVIDHPSQRFNPWIPDLLGADLAVLSAVRPPAPAVAGEAAVALAAAGASMVMVLAELPEADLARLESGGGPLRQSGPGRRRRRATRAGPRLQRDRGAGTGGLGVGARADRGRAQRGPLRQEQAGRARRGGGTSAALPHVCPAGAGDGTGRGHAQASRRGAPGCRLRRELIASRRIEAGDTFRLRWLRRSRAAFRTVTVTRSWARRCGCSGCRRGRSTR